MTGAVVISWENSVPGREAKSLEVFTQALGFFEGLAKQGRIHGHKEYLSVTGKSTGFMIVEGELNELLKILGEEQQRRLQVEASLIVENFTVQVYAGGTDNALQHEITTYVESAQKLGYF